ncbi:hypothetical protein [Caulobacter sp. UC70_42]|uniref:hypothetical protein n=1 Tax=Caulobacter sp. UC70_42 TaxID=3374551 RepID=UPI00375823B8
MEAAEKAADEVRRIVAKAMFDAQAEDGESFDDLTEEEQASFDFLADAAIKGYRAHLHERGYKITPPGAFVAPSSEQEARAMLSVATSYLQKPKGKSKLIATPGLIVPGRMQ